MTIDKRRTLLLCCLLAFCFYSFANVFACASSKEQCVSSAKSAIVMEKDSQRVIFEKNSNQKLPMASTTKIATAITVIENCSLDEVVTIPAKACGVEGSSLYLTEGEKLTVEQLLYGLMLRSGNDCAVAIAMHVSGSVEEFAKLMNKTAKSIGCLDTNFVNPHGLHDDNHYTTASDLAKITCYALRNPKFAQIANTKKITLTNCDGQKTRVLINKNKMLSNFDYADGVKTGFTKNAGRCFVGSATKNGMQMVVVLLNCAPMFEEAQSLLSYALENYALKCIVPQNKICGTLQNGKKFLICPHSVYYPLRQDELGKYHVEIDKIACTLKVYLSNNQIFSCKLQMVE